MELPQPITAVVPRSVTEIADAAHAVQANVVTLKTAFQRRANRPSDDHDIRTPAPGPVRRARELLLDLPVIKRYTDAEIQLRLRQVWGEFCALCWLFPHVDPQSPICFGELDVHQVVQCTGEANRKMETIQKGLWRLRHEQRLRHDPLARTDGGFQQQHAWAVAMRLDIQGEDVSGVSDDVVFQTACEYAGMLAAFRWALDDRWDWEGAGIMDVALTTDQLKTPQASN